MTRVEEGRKNKKPAGVEEGKKNKRSVGKAGESAVERHMNEGGYRILYRNFRYGRFGEIDIIAQKEGVLCFVEVKSRSSCKYGSPAESVTAKKRQKILKVAEYFLSLFQIKGLQPRFDVAEVFLDRADAASPRVTAINYIENAFTG